MEHGFHIKTLRISGNQKKPAELSFGSGLNVISGASNTGKSYIFQCLDYMLGAGKLPKEIEEGKGYSIFELEIRSNRGDFYTLRRSLNGGKISIKDGTIDGNGKEEEYADRLGNDPKNISTFLLGLCGFHDIDLKKSQSEKVRLSFRDISGITLVDEQKIITESSPAYYSNETINRIKEQSLFYYLLTGQDAKEFKAIEDIKTFKGKINGKIELVKELIDKTQGKLSAYKGQNIDDLTKEVQESLNSLSLEYDNYILRIDELKKNRNLYHVQKTKKESTALFKRELLDRFELLKKHYLSDLDRLKFIAEGNFLFRQLNSVSCPVCGSELKDEHINCLIKYEEENVLMETASQSEVHKIALKLDELTETINNLKVEIESNTNLIVKLGVKIAESDTEIERSLAPVTATLRQRINQLFQEKARLEEYNRLRDLITSYAHQINDLNELLKTRSKQNRQSTTINKGAIDRFCEIVENTLKEWKFPGITSVVFDEKYDNFDILINNNNRKSNGKGIRAITYSSFIVSLMKYCHEKSSPHSYNIVFDSPLTTFKESDKATDAKDLITQEIEESFFEKLAQLAPDFQIIILDNKEPPLELRDKINYVHFSGKLGVGRPGFFG